MNRLPDPPLDGVEARLSTQMRAAADSITVEGAPQKAVARAAQRERRRLARTGATALAVVGVGAYGLLQLEPRGSTDLVAALAVDGPTQLAWSIDDAEVLQPLAQFVGTDGRNYALSTAPGVRATDGAVGMPEPPEQAIYRSGDGRDWELVARGQQGLNSLVEHEGLLYGVSTSASADGRVVDELRSSSDGGRSWVSTPFEMTDPAPADPNGLLASHSDSSLTLTTGDGVMIVSAQTWFWPDVAAVSTFLGFDGANLSLEVIGSGVTLNDWAACDAAWARLQDEETGTVVFTEDQGPTECEVIPVVKEATLAELGLTDGLQRHQAWRSVDGGNSWNEIETPGPALANAGGVFIAYDAESLTTGAPSGAFRSTDGLDWEPIADDLPGYLDLVGAVGDRLMARVYQGGGELLVTSADGGLTWDTIDVTSLAPDLGDGAWIMSVETGELGAVMVMASSFEFENVDYRVLFSADGVDWTVQDLGSVELPTTGFPSWAFVGTDHVGVVFEGVAVEPDGSLSGVTLLGTPTR